MLEHPLHGHHGGACQHVCCNGAIGGVPGKRPAHRKGHDHVIVQFSVVQVHRAGNFEPAAAAANHYRLLHINKAMIEGQLTADLAELKPPVNHVREVETETPAKGREIKYAQQPERPARLRLHKAPLAFMNCNVSLHPVCIDHHR